jgi:hypothetical protein
MNDVSSAIPWAHPRTWHFIYCVSREQRVGLFDYSLFKKISMIHGNARTAEGGGFG